MDGSSKRSSAEAFPSALAKLREALAHVANGDVGPIKAFYSHADDATSMYGWGGYEKGWSAISTRWDWAAQALQGAEFPRPVGIARSVGMVARGIVGGT